MLLGTVPYTVFTIGGWSGPRWMTVIESAVASFLSALLSGSRRRWTRPSLALRRVSRCLVRIPGTAASWQTALPVFSSARGSSKHEYFRTTHLQSVTRWHGDTVTR